MLQIQHIIRILTVSDVRKKVMSVTGSELLLHHCHQE